MKERRSLKQGLKETPQVDTVVAREFIYGKNSPMAVSQPAAPPPSPKPTSVIKRTAFSSRLRDDLAKAVKQASLQRQIDGVEPNTVQEIMEEAIEPWLRTHGYLT